jgi:hypothetical protein
MRQNRLIVTVVIVLLLTLTLNIMERGTISLVSAACHARDPHSKAMTGPAMHTTATIANDADTTSIACTSLKREKAELDSIMDEILGWQNSDGILLVSLPPCSIVAAHGMTRLILTEIVLALTQWFAPTHSLFSTPTDEATTFAQPSIGSQTFSGTGHT